tara:strand:- start:54 stop:431 length:378 start_codon:yes stop_codon:yes gene_type:complete
MAAPTQIIVSKSKRNLTVKFDTVSEYDFPAEYLRVFSPSAEVRGHGRGQEVLQYGKRKVEITSINQAGNYAIQIIFSDGHDSGIFSWDYLQDLGSNYTNNWIDYLGRLNEAGQSRDPDVQIVKLV